VPEPYALESVDLAVPPNARGIPYRLALHVYPDPGPDAPVVVIFPAMGTPARFYRPLAQRLGADGIAVVVADLRGTGASTPTPSRADRYGYADMAADVAAVLDALKPRLDGRRHYLLGHSLGGQLATLHLALGAASGDASTPDGLILVAVGLPYYRSYRRGRRLAVLVFSQAIAAVTAVCRVWPGWAFGGRASRRVMLDWAYTARRGRFPALAGNRVDLGLVRTPVLAISIPRDRYTPHATLDRLCAQLTGAPITRVRLDETALDQVQRRGPSEGNSHFSWVRTPEAVTAYVVPFVRQIR
jgi:predicted alpha/beta hydrolase